MVRDLNINKIDALKHELKQEFPILSDSDLDSINNSFAELINSISVKTHKNKGEVEKIVEGKLEFINSKDVI